MAFDLSSSIPSLSPLASAGVDPDEALASGDPYGWFQKRYMPVQAPQAPSPVTRTSLANPVTPQPANNAPNPASEPTGATAVPSTVTPSGKSRFSDIANQALQQKMSTLGQAANTPPGTDVNALETQRAKLAAAAPNPQDAQYKPSVGRRIARGFEGVGLGLAEGGLRGAIAGGIAPQTTGLAGYRDPNSKFAANLAQNQQQVANLDQEIAQGNTGAKQRAEDVKNQTDIGKEFGSAATQANELGGSGKTPSIDDQYSAAVKDALDNDRDPATDKKVQQLADAKTSLQKQTPAKEPSREDKAVAIYAKDPKDRTPEENAFIKGYEHDVKVTKTDPGTARMSVLLQYPQAVADPSTPGGVKFVTRKDAVGQQAPSSASVRVPAKVLEDFTSGADAKTIARFNTAHDHLDELDKVSGALKNGDVRLLNELGNRWATETGQAAPTNFDAVKAAVAGEVAGTFKGSGATDEEIAQITNTIQSKNSPDELRGVIREYRTLIGSKRDNLKNQYEQGLKGKPNFGNSTPPPSGREVSMDDARKLPSNKGKSDDEIRKDIEAHGHRVKE
jgi:hypothetical protein